MSPGGCSINEKLILLSLAKLYDFTNSRFIQNDDYSNFGFNFLQNFGDLEAEKAIMGSIVFCIHHKDGCKWSDELRKLKVIETSFFFFSFPTNPKISIFSKKIAQFTKFRKLIIFIDSRLIWTPANTMRCLAQTNVEPWSLASWWRIISNTHVHKDEHAVTFAPKNLPVTLSRWVKSHQNSPSSPKTPLISKFSKIKIYSTLIK